MKSHIRKAISLKASFYLLCEDFSFFTMGPYGLPNITLQIPRKECQQTASWGLRCNPVTWIHRSERSLSESCFHVLSWWYFLYQHRSQCDAKKPFSYSSETVLMYCSTKHKCNFVKWIHTSPKFLTRLLSTFLLRIFPLSPQVSLRSEVSHCRFPENCFSKLNTEDKRVTLWVAFTHRNAFSQKASFQFWSEDISFFTIALSELPNKTL